jgi:hypothetical protein
MVTKFNHGHPWLNRFDLDRPLAIESDHCHRQMMVRLFLVRKQNFQQPRKGCAEKVSNYMCCNVVVLLVSKF